MWLSRTPPLPLPLPPFVSPAPCPTRSRVLPTSNWRRICGSTARLWRHWRPASGAPGGWRACAETSSCRRCATCRSTPSSCARCTGLCTTSRSWSGCASTTRPATLTSGTAEVSAWGGGVSRGYCVPTGADALFRTWSNIFCPLLVFHVKKAVVITMASLFHPLLHTFSPSILPGLVHRTLEKLHLESAPYRKLSSTSMVETHHLPLGGPQKTAGNKHCSSLLWGIFKVPQ